MVDTTTVVSALSQAQNLTSIEAIDLISKVDAFYNSAWNKLILFGSILFGVVGVVVPLVIQWYQKRVLRVAEEGLRVRLGKEIREELMRAIENRFNDQQRQIQVLQAAANSKILFAQAKFSIEKNAYKGALGELVTASASSMECDDYRTLQEILDYIHSTCLPNLSLEEISDLSTANVCDLASFLESLSKKDDRAMFQTKIGEIRVLLSKLPKTVRDKSEDKSTGN
jgi:hypothetical protein